MKLEMQVELSNPDTAGLEIIQGATRHGMWIDGLLLFRLEEYLSVRHTMKTGSLPRGSRIKKGFLLEPFDLTGGLCGD